MKQISGYVLVKGSSIGVPHVVVSAHDAGETAPGLVEEQRLAALIQQLGRRLGSVLTDSNGRFEMDADDLRFEGNDARPNLMIVVHAPEDVQSAENPAPLPPEARILYISSFARRDAGAEEAFVIRLLPQQMERFGLATTAASSQGSAIASRTADTLEGAWEASDVLRSRFQARIKTQVDAVHKRRATAKRLTGKLSGIPVHLRGADNPLYNNAFQIADRQGLTQLPAVQQASLQQSLDRMTMRATVPVMRLYLTAAEIAALGLKVDDAGNVSGAASTAAVIAKMRDAMSGFDLIRKHDALLVSTDDLTRRYLRGADMTAPVQQPSTAAGQPEPAPRRTDPIAGQALPAAKAVAGPTGTSKKKPAAGK